MRLPTCLKDRGVKVEENCSLLIKKMEMIQKERVTYQPDIQELEDILHSELVALNRPTRISVHLIICPSAAQVGA